MNTKTIKNYIAEFNETEKRIAKFEKYKEDLCEMLFKETQRICNIMWQAEHEMRKSYKTARKAQHYTTNYVENMYRLTSISINDETVIVSFKGSYEYRDTQKFPIEYFDMTDEGIKKDFKTNVLTERFQVETENTKNELQKELKRLQHRMQEVELELEAI